MKEKIQQHIGGITLIAAILGLLSQGLQFVDFIPRTIYRFFGFVYFRFLNIRFFNYSDYDSQINISYLNLFFYLTLLIAGILYFSKKKETRLIKFCFSIVFVAKALAIPQIIVNLFLNIKQVSQIPDFSWSIAIFNIALNIAWAVLAYQVIRILQNQSSLQINNKMVREEMIPVFVPASKWKRFFHLYLDLFICVIVISNFSFLGLTVYLERLLNFLGPRTSLWIFLIIYRLIYYPFFETIFGATPAKFLTGTRVINKDGSKPTLKTTILRTLSRFVPFEPFSFLGEKGWHDDWTETQVVEEQKNGIPGGRYFLIPLFYLTLVLGCYFGIEAYHDAQEAELRQQDYNVMLANFKNRVAHVTKDDFLKLKKKKTNYNDKTEVYLKIDTIDGETIHASVFSTQKTYTLKLGEIEDAYLNQRASAEKVKFQKADLFDAFQAYKYLNNRNGFDFLGDGTLFTVTDLCALYAPYIRNRGTGSQGKSNLNLEMTIMGHSASLISIETIEGDIDWTNELPQRLELIDRNKEQTFSLRGINYTRGTPYKVIFKIRDDNGSIQVYLLQGTGMRRTLGRHYE